VRYFKYERERTDSSDHLGNTDKVEGRDPLQGPRTPAHDARQSSAVVALLVTHISKINQRRKVMQTHEPEKNRPAHQFRFGPVKAIIWPRETTAGVRHNVTLARLYRDQDQWKQTQTFGRDDLLPLAKALDLAHTWICEREQQEVRSADSTPRLSPPT